jgi:hypothetical protein
MGHELTFPRSVCSGSIPLPLSSAPQYRPLGTFCVEKRPGPVFAPHTQNPTQNDLDNLIFHDSRIRSTPSARRHGPIPSLDYPVLIPVPPPHYDLTIHRLLWSNSSSVANAVLFFTRNKIVTYAIITNNDE